MGEGQMPPEPPPFCQEAAVSRKSRRRRWSA